MVLTRTSSISSKIVEKYSTIDRLRWFLNTMFHQLVTLVSGFILYILLKYIDYHDIHFLHYILCSMAYIPLMAEGLMLFSEANVWNLTMRRNTKYYLHGPLLAVSTISVTVGIVVHIYHKNKNGTIPFNEHFKSTHSITGLVSWILSMLSVILGLFAFFSVKLRRIVRPVVLKALHNFFGLAAFTIGVTALCFGLGKTAFRGHVTDTEHFVAVTSVITVAVWCGMMAIVSLINQIGSIL